MPKKWWFHKRLWELTHAVLPVIIEYLVHLATLKSSFINKVQYFIVFNNTRHIKCFTYVPYYTSKYHNCKELQFGILINILN